MCQPPTDYASRTCATNFASELRAVHRKVWRACAKYVAQALRAPTCRVHCTFLREVSTHGIRLVLSALERLGVPIRSILAEVPASEAELRASGGRVDWDVWVALIESVERHTRAHGGFDALSKSVEVSRNHPFQAVARLVSSPLALYQLNSRWGVPNQYRHMRSRCEPLPGGRVRVELSIPTSYRGSIIVFRSSLGILKNLPTLIGLPPSEVVSFEATPHGLSAVLALPRSRTLLSRSRRIRERMRGLGSVLTQLDEQELELDAKSVILERQLEQQKNIEQALRASEERWRALAENAPAIILILSESGRLLSASRPFRGVLPAELVGRAFLELIEPSERELVAGAIESVHEELATRDVRFHSKEGDRDTWYACRLGPIGAAGARAGVCAFLVDITERLRAERELKEREEELQRSRRLESLGRLAGGVAHDFNNLLTVIRGSAGLLLGGARLDDEQLEEVQQIDRAAERAATLTRQLLAFSRQQVIAPEPLRLEEVVAQARPMLERLMGEDILLDVHAELDLPHVLLDRSQVDQILMNLAVNARDAMPRGGTLRIDIHQTRVDETSAVQHDLPRGRYVELSVEDSGLGMESEVKARIFEPFFSTKPRGAGTGLGLAIVRGIVAQSGGDVTVESELGRGTTFRLRFPVCAGPGAATSALAESVPLEDGGRETILVVEDDAQVRAYVAKVLRMRGYRVLDCESGAEALAMAAAERPDLLLSDVVMPEIAGPELSRLIAENHPEIAVLFISGYAEHEIVHRGIVKRDVSLLTKPFNADALARAVRDCLDRHLRGRRKSG